MISINLTNSSAICVKGAAPRPARQRRDSEGGYTLVALLLVMSLLALWAVAAAENRDARSRGTRASDAGAV